MATCQQQAKGCRRTLVLGSTRIASIRWTIWTTCAVRATRALHQHGVIGVCLDVFLEILRTLERLAAEVAAMRLQRNVNADVGGDVVAFDDLNMAVAPRALQIEVVGALATDVALTYVILLVCLLVDGLLAVILVVVWTVMGSYIELFGAAGACAAPLPLAHEVVVAARRWWDLLRSGRWPAERNLLARHEGVKAKRQDTRGIARVEGVDAADSRDFIAKAFCNERSAVPANRQDWSRSEIRCKVTAREEVLQLHIESNTEREGVRRDLADGGNAWSLIPRNSEGLAWRGERRTKELPSPDSLSAYTCQAFPPSTP